MPNKGPTLVVTAVILALVLGAVVLGRRPIYHALAERQMSHARSIVGEYLAGKLTMDSAAVALMRALERSEWYEDQVRPEVDSGAGSLTAIRIAPLGVSEDDPRVSALFRRGIILRLDDPEARARMEASFRRLDSLEAADRARTR
jgi:hypothetical protein